jgi:septal ring factor EnvC (AmiA/AmiB activator)
MAQPQIKTSQRFSRAARAERDRLQRQRAQLDKKRQQWLAKVSTVEAEVEAIDKQLQVLEELADPSAAPIEIHSVERRDPDAPEQLSGAGIRAVAVPLLIRKHGPSPIHYRDWYALLQREGYEAAGKRPDAVFLNQVSRSPLIRTTTKAGYYILDLEALEQLRERLRQQQAELGQLLKNVPEDGPSLEAHRQRQQELNTEINRTERELGEAVAAVDAADAQAEPAPLQAKAA